MLDALQYLGLIALGIALFQASQLILGNFRRRQHAGQIQEIELQCFEEKLATLRDERKRKAKSEAGWNGVRKFIISRKVPEGGDICSFYLKPHDRKSIPSFKPGQYLTFQLKIAGQSKPVIRCYSLSDKPNPDFYRVSIKRVPAPPGTDFKPGIGSNYFHDELKEGDILDVKCPSGQFFFDSPKSKPVVLIGGGIGLTPVLSMVKHLTSTGDKREIWFFYGIRNGSEHVMRAEMLAVKKEFPHVKFRTCYSKPGKDDVEDKDYHLEGRVSVDLFKKVLPSNNYDFYLCGPPAMMASMNDGLKAWGVPSKDVYFETFGPSSVKKTRPPIKIDPKAAAAPQMAVTFKQSGKTVSWSNSCENILELAEENGIEIPSGCRAGNCGTCNIAVNSGDFEHLQEPGFEPDDGTCLACIAAPKGNITLEA